MPSLDENLLRNILRGGRYEWRKHVLERLAERGILQGDVLKALFAGERIEDYPEDTPYPSGLYLGWVKDKPLHAVVSLDAEREWAYIITAYEPDLEHFEADFKTRRKRP